MSLFALELTSSNQVIPIFNQLVLGKDPSCCDITLTHPRASRKHFQIFPQNGKILIKDLESSSGTFVNSEKIAEDEPHILHPGDKISIGEGEVFVLIECGENEKIEKAREKILRLRLESERIRTKEKEGELTAGQQKVLERNAKEISNLEKSIISELQKSSPRNEIEEEAVDDSYWDVAVADDPSNSLVDLTSPSEDSSQKVHTYDSLMNRIREIDERRVALENHIRDLDSVSPTDGEAEEIDEVDKCMAENDQLLKSSDQEKARKTLAGLITEKEKFIKLANIARPAHLKPQDNYYIASSNEESKKLLEPSSEEKKALASGSQSFRNIFHLGDSSNKAPKRVKLDRAGQKSKINFVNDQTQNTDNDDDEPQQPQQYDELESDITISFIPPSNQKGDGKTKANETFGY